MTVKSLALICDRTGDHSELDLTDVARRRATVRIPTVPTLESRHNPPYLTGLLPSHLRELCARIAQSVEHILGKDEVIGSIPIASSAGPFHLGGFDPCTLVHERTRRLR
jgi:hypothetical protein